MEGEKFAFHETVETINNGDDFQFIMGKFVLYRLIHQKFKHFRFTREKRGCGKFDDLVFSYVTNDEKSKYHLMQLKCMANEEYKIGYEDLTTNPNSYFLLPFYFDHYLESLKYLSQDKDLKDSDLEELIICTNVGIEDSLGCITKQEISNRGLFYNSGNICKLSINELNKRKEIFHDQFLSDRERLASELVLGIMLKKTINVQSMILSQTSSLIKRFYRMLITHVIDIKLKKFKASFLTEDFNESIQELQDFRKAIFKSLIKFYESYKDKSYEDLRKLIYFGRFKNVTDQKSKVNTLRSLLKNFNCQDIDKFLKKRHIEIIGIPNEDTEIVFPSGTTDENFIDQNILTFLELLTFAVNQTRNEKLISSEIDKPLILVGFNSYMKNWYCQGVSLQCMSKSKKNYRRWITEQTLLEELKRFSIYFQGRIVKFSDICPSSAVNTPEMIMIAFSENKVFNLGKPSKKRYNKMNIDRILTQRKKVIRNVFLESTDGFIIVTLENISDMMNLQKRYPSNIEIKNLVHFDVSHPFYFTYREFSFEIFKSIYNRSLKDNSEKNFHWLTFMGVDLKFESSYPSSSTFFEQFCQGNRLFKELELVGNEEFLIITGDPGIGKTTLLKNVSNLVKETQKYWVIMTSFNKCKDFLPELDRLDKIETVIDFLAKCDHCYDSISRTILKGFLVNEPHLVVIIFDGFDEVNNLINRKKVIQLLRFLKNENIVKQIWISTRYHYVKQLEDALGVVAFEINDFTEEDQISLVTKVWKKASTLFSIVDFIRKNLIQRIESNAESLIRSFNISIKSQERKFLGIPLHTFMLAIAFEEAAISPTPIRLEQMNLVKLYEYFFRKKFKIFFDERIKDEALSEEVIDYYQVQYQLFALQSGDVINPNDSWMLTNMLQSKIKYYNLCRIGLIHMTDKGFKFIHKTFAEYLIADYLSSNIKIYMNKEKDLRTIKNVLLDDSNDFMLYLFDAMFVDKIFNCEVQKSIMLGDELFVKRLIKDSLNKLDILERSNFYYALKYRQFHIIRILIEKDIDLKLENYFLSCLISFAKICKSHYFTRNSLEENTYINLFEYILKKEDEKGLFTREYLHLCLDLEEEIFFHHWKIVSMLIDKFHIKIPVNSCCLYEISHAPESCFSIFVESISKIEYFPLTHTVCAAMLDKLLNFEPSVLKNMISSYRSFLLLIPIGRLSLNQKEYMYNNFLKQINSVNFSGFINYIKRRSENFKTFSTFLLEQGIPFEQFDMELKAKGTDHFRIIYFGLDSCLHFDNICFFLESKMKLDIKRPVSSVMSIQSSSEEKQRYKEDFWTVLRENERICKYNDSTSIMKAMQNLINYIIGSDNVTEITGSIRKFHKCLTEKKIDEAFLLWDEFKKTTYSKALILATNENDENALQVLSNILREKDFKNANNLMDDMINNLNDNFLP